MDIREYIEKCDADFRARLYDIADEVARSFENQQSIRLVSLSGPTCSGKTTAASMLAERLQLAGKRVHIISIDDFFFDRPYLEELSRRAGHTGIDYDSEKTIDLEALELFIDEALGGESAHCPIFDFKTGLRDGYRLVQSGKDDVFVFEGIQAVYPDVVRLLEPHGFISIYIAPLTPLSHGDEVFLPDEIRFLRRIVRDAEHRGTCADTTMKHWENVRINEEKNIFPYADGCVYRIDSTHAYELGVLKPHLEKVLSEVREDSVYRSAADAILEKIKDIPPIASALIDEHSLYKEFI